jgi:hypothetical protein
MDKKVQLNVVPPFFLVAGYPEKSGGSSADGAVCGGCNKKDNLPNQQSLPADRLVVLSCRDGEITSHSSVISYWSPENKNSLSLAALVFGLFPFRSLQKQVFDGSKRKKPVCLCKQAVFICRDGEIRTHDFHVPNVAR